MAPEVSGLPGLRARGRGNVRKRRLAVPLEGQMQCESKGRDGDIFIPITHVLDVQIEKAERG